MPSQAELEEEREAEDAARSREDKASKDEQDGKSADASKKYSDAGRDWSEIGESYFRKSQESGRTPGEAAEYLCRAGAAWLRAAKDYERAARLTANKDEADALQRVANNCFKRAAHNFETCGESLLELDDPEAARASLVQADSCYLLWKYSIKKLDPEDTEVETADIDLKRLGETLRKARKLVRERTKEK